MQTRGKIVFHRLVSAHGMKATDVEREWYAAFLKVAARQLHGGNLLKCEYGVEVHPAPDGLFWVKATFLVKLEDALSDDEVRDGLRKTEDEVVDQLVDWGDLGFEDSEELGLGRTPETRLTLGARS